MAPALIPAASLEPGFTLVRHIFQRADGLVGHGDTFGDTIPYHSRLRVLMTVSISLATVSVFAAFTAFYWFVRMRRSFRQE